MPDTKHIAFESMGTNVRALVDARVREVSDEMSGIVQSQLQKQQRISAYSRTGSFNNTGITTTETNPVVVLSNHPLVYQMIGMDINTGKLLSGVEHLRQSITDILTTFFGTRVMRRTYGSELFALIDAAGNKQTIVQVYYAIAVALHLWEPRFDLIRVQASDQTMSGEMNFIMEGNYLGQKITMKDIHIQ